MYFITQKEEMRKVVSLHFLSYTTKHITIPDIIPDAAQALFCNRCTALLQRLRHPRKRLIVACAGIYCMLVHADRSGFALLCSDG